MTRFSHHPVQEVATRHVRPSLGFWSMGLPTRLVLFVHGFKGDACKTWKNFPSFVMQQGGRDLDVLSYQYDGFTTQANSSAVELGDFLEEFLQNPGKVVNKTVPDQPRKPGFRYAKIVIAAHSLGAVVVRLALLRSSRRREAGKISADWLDQVRLVLFAPAHRGAYSAELATYMLSQTGASLFTLAGAAIKHNIPLIEDLRPGSATLTQLESETLEQLVGSNPLKPQVVASNVIWARREKIVVNQRFCRDPDAEQIEADHSEVCKPASASEPTIGWIMDALR